MYPTATAFLPSLDARWADPVPSSALETLEKGFPEQAAQEAAIKKAAEEHEPLSKKIAKDQEAQARNEAETEAQDQPDNDLDEAQDSRQFQGMVSSPRSGSDRADTGLRHPEAGSNASHGPLAQGRVPGRVPVPAAIVKPMVSGTTTPATTLIATQTAEGMATGTVVRNVPAAVLRAIEVEASLELGGKGTSSLRSSMTGRSGKSGGTRALAESELRTLRGMTSLLAQRGGRLRVHLHPVQLGPIQIDVEVNGDRVRAVIETATRGASKILEASTSRLKTALESQGYTLDRLEIRHQGLSAGEAEDAESREDDSRQDDSHRTQEDGQSSRRWRSTGSSPVADEEFTFAELGEQERAR